MIKVEVPKWRWDDPFGRNALKSVCYDLKKALCEAEGYKVERDEMLKARSEACDGLAAHINDALALARTLDDMRKQLAERNKKLREENEMLRRIVSKTPEELAEWIAHPKICYCQHDICDGETDCAECALVWLKQEVNDGRN